MSTPEKNPTQRWLEYFECTDTREIKDSPKFLALLETLGSAIKNPVRYFLSQHKLHICDDKGIYGYELAEASPLCISATLVLPGPTLPETPTSTKA